MINTKLFKRKIKYSNLTRQEISKRAGISYMSLYHIAKGKNIPSVEVAIKLSHILNFDIEDIWVI